MTAEELAYKLGDAKGRNGQYMARCPAHDDKNASLSIGTGEGGCILLNCHAKCTHDAVMSALERIGIKRADLMPEYRNDSKEVIYDYTDSDGKLLAQKLRRPGKKFFWRRPNGCGGFIYDTKGVTIPLYNLPAVVKSDKVYVVEGEKDVATLTLQGIVATCNPDGAGDGKWKPHHSKALTGKTVIIIPDNDEVGIIHAQNIATAVHGVAKSVKLLDLIKYWPEKPEHTENELDHVDVTDFFESYRKKVGGDAGNVVALECLRMLEEKTPEFNGLIIREANLSVIEKTVTPAISPLVSLNTVLEIPPEYSWEPYLRAKNVNVVRGDGGTGKTMFVMALGAVVTSGYKPIGMPGIIRCERGSVLYYGAEDDNGEYKHRATLCGCAHERFFLVSEGQALPMLSNTDIIRAHVKQTGAKLIVFDPIQYFLGSSVDMNKANEVRPLLEGLRCICREMDCTAIIVEHLNKATQQKAHYRGIGTVDFINASRSALMVGWHPTQQGMRVAIPIKANAKYGLPIMFSIDDTGRFSWHGTCDVTEDEVANARRTCKDTSTVDPVLSLVIAIMDEYPEGWQGTISQMLAVGSAYVDCSLITKPESIGKRLPSLKFELQQRGIKWQYARHGSRREHRFSRQLSMTDMTDMTPVTDNIASLPVTE